MTAVLFLFVINKESVQDKGNLSPLGVPYHTELNGITYVPDLYNFEYGHLEDLYGELVEEHKASYLEPISYGDTLFPTSDNTCYYFPAFLAYDALKCVAVPEEIMLEYFTADYVGYVIENRINGYEIEGEKFYDIYQDPHKYLDITVSTILRDEEYKVTYSTIGETYARYFSITEDNKVKEILY